MPVMAVHMSPDQERAQLVAEAERAWLRRWTAGPTEREATARAVGDVAPDAVRPDETGTLRRLSALWAASPVLLMFWRHFGCGCGVMRAERLRAEWAEYLAHGIRPVIVGQGEPARAAAYKAEHELEATVLCDPGHDLFRAYGIGHWEFQQIMLSDPPQAYLDDPVGWGAAIQAQRRETGRPLVDDPWRATAEFVIGTDGVIRYVHAYQHCYDPPDPSDLIAAV